MTRTPTNVSSFGSDVASVMTGSEGVATHLKRLNSNIISIHCVAHRLALAAGQASVYWIYTTPPLAAVRNYWTVESEKVSISEAKHQQKVARRL